MTVSINLADYCARMPDGAPCPDPEQCQRTFREVLDKSDDDLQEKIAQVLKLQSAPSVLRQAFINIDTERLLPCRFWRGLMTKIADIHGDAVKLRDAIREYMQTTRFRGPQAKVKPDTVLGRATTREDLAGHFTRKAYFPEELAAMLSIEEAVGSTVGEIRARWGHFELGRYVMWATFDLDGHRPFQHAGGDAKKLRGRLGLNRRDLNKPVFTLEYTLPPGVSAHLPTVAEAYASDPWLPSFRPVSPEQAKEGFGLTHSIEEYADEPGLPEVVHEPVRGSALAYPPREIA
jgi:hypothetical protein